MNPNFFQSSFTIPTGNATVAQAVAPGAVATSPPSLCPSDLPLVLLPVRLETRFFRLANGTMELRVRVYPDKIHMDSHEPDLTPDEQTWGQHYWQQEWLAAADATARLAAWRQIADRFGAARAAWIVRLTTPTNPADRPAGIPAFPTLLLATTNDAWRRAPQARLLPDRWIAVVHSSGSVVSTVTSADIRKPLNVGPKPSVPAIPAPEVKAAIERGERTALDDEMLWMVDFNEAETCGMGLRIPVAETTVNAGIDSLLVYGVVRSMSVADTAAQLADLLDAHHYTDGLALLRPGTPTNNTDDRRAGYNSKDLGWERSFALEIAPPPATTEVTNATRVGTALGLPLTRIDATFGRIEGAQAHDELDMRAMNTALWQVGWGYFLSNMVGAEGGMTPQSLDWARSYFVNHVRAFGPFPTLRCGAQPYGILPVTSLDSWQPTPAEVIGPQDAWLMNMLKKLRDGVWRPALPSVPRVGLRRPGPGSPNMAPDPDADLADVMRTDAISGRYDTRNVFGRHFLQHLFLRMSPLGQDAILDRDNAQTALLGQIAMGSWTPRLTRLWNASWQWRVSTPLIQAGEVSPWTKLESNYIDALLGPLDIAALTRPAAPPSSLLHALLRHAYLREIAFATASLKVGSPTADGLLPLLRDDELIDLVTNGTQLQQTQHWLRQLDATAGPTATGGRTIREFLQDPATTAHAATAALGQFRASLARLKDLDSEALLQLMQGTLDLSAHRLDAWITSFATRRLSSMQADGAAGQYIGAYAWVENLRPIRSGLANPVTTLPAGEPAPLQSATNDSGFIHAPSITHAATAALLRNAHLGPGGAPSATDPFAIDLSSRRVREAARLLDGVRQGQPLGALLGYRIERLLHDIRVDNNHSLDYLIAPLRQLAPLAPRARSDAEITNAPVLETIAANNVVDGLVLQLLWKQNPQTNVIDKIAAKFKSTGDLAAVTTVLNSLNDMVDGVTDALTAETAYQMARGNTSRVASTLASIAEGNASPPELEVTRTPRTGTAVTHRLLSLMSGAVNLNTPGWFAGDAGVRSTAERLLNFWASRLLGDGSKVRCTVEQLDASGAVVETRRLPLTELSLTPLDIVYGVEATMNAPDATPPLSEIEQYLLYYTQHRAGGFAANATLRVQHARPKDLAIDEITLFDALEQARAIRRLLSTVRSAEPEDLNAPERVARATLDLTELDTRATRAENVFNAAHKGLLTLAAKPTTTTAEQLRTGMLKLWVYGLASAIPISPSGEDPAAVAALLRQAQSLLKQSVVRFDRMNALRLLPLATEPRARRDQIIERMQNLFGASFLVLPRFTFDAAGATELTSAFAASTATQGGDALAANTWFTRCARVRDPVARFGQCLRTADVLGAPARLNLTVAQLPFATGDRWIALQPLAGQEIPSGKVSLVIHTVGAINATQLFTGLVVDEWTEIVPNTRETTALAFQFDVPDSCAPQCVLVAVPPVRGQDWTVESLRQVLMETLDLAKLRAADTGSLGAAAQHLPGLYFAFNTQDHAVSTDFAPLTA